ncbi:Uncharacterized protein ChrSV_0580 [Chromobacterium vaccinii]|nr:Uncharacterized protein ChrSW_0580 [Chromobacterium vaccinii]QND88039.1 Uncharacterized protein ChrSV_0580 [Chromobacterium vaccinii]
MVHGWVSTSELATWEQARGEPKGRSVAAIRLIMAMMASLCFEMRSPPYRGGGALNGISRPGPCGYPTPPLIYCDVRTHAQKEGVMIPPELGGCSLCFERTSKLSPFPAHVNVLSIGA